MRAPTTGEIDVHGDDLLPSAAFSQGSVVVVGAAVDGGSTRQWTVHVEIDDEFPPGSSGALVEPFGEGAILSIANSSAPGRPMVLVVLHPDRPADVWNLGDWRIEDVRPDAVLLSRSGGDGLELGIIRAV